MPAETDEKKTKKSSLRIALENPKVWVFLGKVTLFALFFVGSFNTANSQFFNEYPIFGIPFLAEFMIGLAFGIFGFHTVPIISYKVKVWFEHTVTNVISDIIYDFWNQQSRKMNDAKRKKQQEKKLEREKQDREMFQQAILIDTSVLIDGRIVDLVKTGFLDYQLIVPQGVVDEMHLLSDSSEDLKRKKGRRGLDVLNDLKKVAKVKIYKAPGDVTLEEGVDKELIRLTKKYKGKLMTMDFNLNKVAKATSLTVLNINELANAVKLNVIPGQKMKIQIVQGGKEKNQGVGYLEDGTMVVVENAKDEVGKKLTVTVAKVIQTDAGKMVFTEM